MSIPLLQDLRLLHAQITAEGLPGEAKTAEHKKTCPDFILKNLHVKKICGEYM